VTTEIVAQERAEIAPTDAGAAVLAVIARAAADPNVDVAKMQALLEMQERILAKQAEAEFTAAMARVQPQLPRITKKGRIEYEKNGKITSTPFAKYEDVDAAIKPLLCGEGFSISFGTSPLEKGGITITATLSHRGGHSKTVSMPLPFDTSGSKNSIQAVGSTLSYGKRYLVCAMLNIVTENEDDDATGHMLITDEQKQLILDMFHQANMDDKSKAKFLEFMGVESVEMIRQGDMRKAVNALQIKARKAQTK